MALSSVVVDGTTVHLDRIWTSRCGSEDGASQVHPLASSGGRQVVSMPRGAVNEPPLRTTTNVQAGDGFGWPSVKDRGAANPERVSFLNVRSPARISWAVTGPAPTVESARS